jgi:quercetin dioxygenase-like cupin family protein
LVKAGSITPANETFSINIFMKNFHHLNSELLENPMEIQQDYPAKSRYMFAAPFYNTDYHEPSVNQQEMEDFHEPISILIRHSDSTSIGLKGIISSHPRPDSERVMDAPLLEFDLNKEIQHIKLEGNWAAGKQTAKTLAKSEYMSVVLIAMQQANEMKMQQANGPITVQVMEGNIQFMTWQSCVTIKAGQFITLHKNVQHNMLAKDQSIVLLTIMHMTEEKKSETEEKEIEENQQEVVETSENINFPDFPTYPPKDDVYKEPAETEEPEEK